MDFFSAQDSTRRSTRWLIVMFALGTLAVAAAVTAVLAATLFATSASPQQPAMSLAEWAALHWGTLALIGGGTLVFILVASLVRTATLAGGGSAIARQLGAVEVAGESNDPLRTRLRNVVEEMAIASGVPVPQIFVLEHEPGINAFAAGFGTGDATITVTRGALERLSRDELQGVVAHEFSHILNGDMRLNLRLIGVLFGIMAVYLLGRMLLYGSYGRVRLSGRRSGGAVVAAGLGLVVVGLVGLLFGRLIKAAVSRQRERLADASAVQFTRNPTGLAGALKRIAGLETGSRLVTADGEEVSHMLFASGGEWFAGLFATHPPLLERIRALEPDFDPEALAAPAQVRSASPTAPHATAALAPEAIPDQVGRPDAAAVDHARRLRSGLPDALVQAAYGRNDSLLLTAALFLSGATDTRERQLSLLERKLGDERAGRARHLAEAVRQLGPQYRLPLLELAFPALKTRPPGELEWFDDLLEQLIEQDGRIELFEYALSRLLRVQLGNWLRPDAGRPARPSAQRQDAAAATLLAAISQRQTPDPEGAWRTGWQVLGKAAPGPLPAGPQPGWSRELDAALETLRHADSATRRRLVAAVAAVITHDRRIQAAEAELLRAVCAALDCPLPPLAATDT